MDPRDRLKRIVAICHELMGADEPDAVIAYILRAGVDLLGVESCSLALVDDEELAFVSLVGEVTTPFRIPVGSGIAGAVVQTGRPLVVADVAADDRFHAGIDAQTGFSTRSLACAPMLDHGRVIGVIQALNFGPDGFDEESLALLVALGGLAYAALGRAQRDQRARVTDQLLREAEDRRYRMVATRNDRMQEVMRTARTAAKSSSTILLQGESGTGKEMFARLIHLRSPRAEAPFVAVNCVALSPTLLESELFGHERGAFTGATERKIGKFEAAHGGTLFLDEIGDLRADLQTKLLRVLQERELERVGGIDTIRVDVRLVAATHHDLQAAVAAGRFREDLYYRLNVITIQLPPLRERPEDVERLCRHFIERASHAAKRRPPAIDPDALDRLRRHRWPGNVRELANLMERLVVLAPGDRISVDQLPAGIGPGDDSSAARRTRAASDERPLSERVELFKREAVVAALQRNGGNQTRAARELGLAQSNLSRLMRRLGVQLSEVSN